MSGGTSYGKRHRASFLILFAVIVGMGACLALFFSRTISADMRTMIPQGDENALASDLELLTQSSLAGTMFITVRSNGDTELPKLIQNAESLKNRLEPAGFQFFDLASIHPLQVTEFLLRNSPNLMTEEDLTALRTIVTTEAIKHSLDRAYRQLLSPMSMATKPLIRLDPIGMRSILLPKLHSLNAFDSGEFVNGHMVSRDKQAVLLMARSDIPVTDTEGSEQLINSFASAADTLPAPIVAELVSPHSHTVANARTIQHDIPTVSLLATVLLVLLFWFFFRSKDAAVLLLVPATALCGAMGGLALFAETLSAVVLGFGAVLIGISMDFAIHVYVAMTHGEESPSLAAKRTARPIIYCLATSCAAFGALALSDIPGIRQLAVFAISGLLVSALFSLTVLPTLCGRKHPVFNPRPHSKFSFGKRSLAVLGMSLLVLGFGATRVQLDSDMRSLDATTPSIDKTERAFKETWGQMRDQGILFVHGKTMQEALAHNREAYRELRAHMPDTRIASIAPILPDETTQAANRASWSAFWDDARKAETLDVVATQSSALKFSRTAFAPFEAMLSTTPPPITPSALSHASLEITRQLFMPDNDSAIPTVATFLPDTSAVRDFFTPDREHRLNGRYVSNGMFRQLLSSEMRKDILLFISASGVAAILIVLCLFRNLRQSALSLLPGATGLLTVLGVSGLTGLPLNLFHIAALPLIIGLGSDYGIFMVQTESAPGKTPPSRAILISGLTTLAGFGVLVLANHPSLQAMGTTILLGISASLASALFVLPSLLREAR